MLFQAAFFVFLCIHRPQSSKVLSSRLNEVYKLAAKDNTTTRVADIGCDHAQLAIALLQLEHVQRVVAIDSCDKPLKVGLQNARRANLKSKESKKLHFRKGDGLVPLREEDEIDTVCIAGMGARSILSILDCDALTSLHIKNLVLQPVSSRPHLLVPLKRWLFGNDWFIKDESICQSSGRFYLTMKVSKAEIAVKSLETPHGGMIAEKGISCEKNALLFPAELWTKARNQNTYIFPDQLKELLLYRDYVHLHAGWSKIIRSRNDNYDKASGFSQDAVSELYASELQFLDRQLAVFEADVSPESPQAEV